jgi:prolyl-tRNA synthetase
MKQSELFTKVLRESPKDETSKNAQLLIQAGYVYKEMAGVYTYLPLGLRVLENIMTIIRHEMEAIGGQEMLLTSLQDKQTWEATNRWDDKQVDNWFKTKLANGSELGLAFTHEEPLTRLISGYLSSYKQLPFYAYQFQTKFRNELRAKSGIMRTREFIMKDLYSFSATQEQHDEFYEQAKQAYLRIFNRVGIGDSTFVTFASGGSFSKFSHEFQTLTEAGEDTIYLDRSKGIAINKEVMTPEVLSELGIDKNAVEEVKAVEVGNIFGLGTKFSDALNAKFLDQSGQSQSVIMGSYGIGPGRLMGVVAELLHDDKGLIWPASIAPYQIHLVNIAKDQAQADSLYNALQSVNYSVLYDQRDESAGVKFADSDMIGIPTRVLVSDKTLKEDSVEIKDRASGETQIIKIKDLPKTLKK